jgi:hypothetical protein
MPSGNKFRRKPIVRTFSVVYIAHVEREERKNTKGANETMLPKMKRRGKTDLPNRLNFMDGHTNGLFGSEMSHPYYSKKVVQFH